MSERILLPVPARHQTVIIGTHFSCDVVITGDPRVTSRHAQITRGHGLGCELTALAGAPLTLRRGGGGWPVTGGERAILKPGDVIVVGDVELDWPGLAGETPPGSPADNGQADGEVAP